MRTDEHTIMRRKRIKDDKKAFEALLTERTIEELSETEREE